MRQYQSFRSQVLGPALPFTGGLNLHGRTAVSPLGFLGRFGNSNRLGNLGCLGNAGCVCGLGCLGDMGTAAYRDPKGGSEILTKDAFTEKYGFAPSEEYLVGNPQYNTPDKTPEVLRGAESLPYVRPDIFREKMGKRWTGAPGGPGAPIGPIAPPDSPTITDILLPPVAKRSAKCCMPSCGEEKEYGYTDRSGSVAVSNQAIATAYGGQSVVNIGSPGAQTSAPSGSATQGDSFTAPNLYGTRSPSDLISEPQPEGFLSLITPKTNSDWVKLAVGVGVGVVIAKWLRRRTS